MESRNVSKRRSISCAFVLIAAIHCPASANGVGENFSWQFMTTADKTNRAFIEDLRQRKKGGAFAPPVYYIERQFNCNIAATATGNQGSTSAFAASPSTSGNVTQAKANDSQNRFDTASAFDLFGFPNSAGAINDPRTATGLNSTSSQSNTGMVQASTNGDVKTTLTQNDSEQVINSNQNSSAPQTATVGSSTACSFGVLN
jgi:hypothetical protein